MVAWSIAFGLFQCYNIHVPGNRLAIQTGQSTDGEVCYRNFRLAKGPGGNELHTVTPAGEVPSDVWGKRERRGVPAATPALLHAGGCTPPVLPESLPPVSWYGGDTGTSVMEYVWDTVYLYNLHQHSCNCPSFHSYYILHGRNTRRLDTGCSKNPR